MTTEPKTGTHTPTSAIVKATLRERGLVGIWICECDVCGKQYAQHVGSTECCGSLAGIIAHDPDYSLISPEERIES